MHQILSSEPLLGRFVGADVPAAQCRLMLPHFTGSAVLAGDRNPGTSLVYRGFTFAERDSRAAFCVHSLISTVFEPERVAIGSAVPGQQVPPTVFLFGSRSNPITQEVLQNSGHGLFEFEFGSLWKIHCNGKEFSMPDPSLTLDATQYQNTTDYAVIAKLHDQQNHLIFVIAGLGGRATEGAAQFFVKQWSQLATDFGDDDFAAVLEFTAPFQLHNSRIVTSARRSHMQYRYA
jgi:hypothetical protein